MTISFCVVGINFKKIYLKWGVMSQNELVGLIFKICPRADTAGLGSPGRYSGARTI